MLFLVQGGIIVQEWETLLLFPAFQDHIAQLRAKVTVTYVKLAFNVPEKEELCLSVVLQEGYVMKWAYPLRISNVQVDLCVWKGLHLPTQQVLGVYHQSHAQLEVIVWRVWLILSLLPGYRASNLAHLLLNRAWKDTFTQPIHLLREALERRRGRVDPVVARVGLGR